MSRSYHVRSALATVGFAMLAVGCSPDAVTGPSAAPVKAAPLLGIPLLSTVTGVTTGLVSTVGSLVGITVGTVDRSSDLRRDVTVSKDIGVFGGVISIPAAGLTVTFLPKAVPQTTRITVTAYAGRHVSYGFEPHGITFAAPVVVTQDMSMIKGVSTGSELYGAYLPNGQADIQPDGTANATDVFGTKTTTARVGWRQHTFTSFTIPHFSGYILASGRSGR